MSSRAIYRDASGMPHRYKVPSETSKHRTKRCFFIGFSIVSRVRKLAFKNYAYFADSRIATKCFHFVFGLNSLIRLPTWSSGICIFLLISNRPFFSFTSCVWSKIAFCDFSVFSFFILLLLTCCNHCDTKKTCFQVAQS